MTGSATFGEGYKISVRRLRIDLTHSGVDERRCPWRRHSIDPIAKHLSFVYEPRKLPIVLSPEEVVRFLEARRKISRRQFAFFREQNLPLQAGAAPPHTEPESCSSSAITPHLPRGKPFLRFWRPMHRSTISAKGKARREAASPKSDQLF